MKDYRERDLWREARLRSRSPSLGDRAFNLGQAIRRVSLPGQPVRSMVGLLPGADKLIYMPDFNKYDTTKNLQAYVDAGCKAFLLRLGGPTRWVQSNWGYEIDKTYRPLMEQADKLGVLHRTIGYIVHNPFEYIEVNGATGETIHTELVDDWTSGGWMPQAFMLDHEIDRSWTTTGSEITATDSNLKDHLAANAWNLQRKFGRRVSAYSGGWFLRKTAARWSNHDTYFYQINRSEAEGGVGMQRPLVLAWYPQVWNQVFASTPQISDLLLVPTQEQIARFLYCGVNASAWQFSDSVQIGSEGPVDMSVSCVDEATFCAHFGLLVGPTAPPVEPPSTPPVEPPVDLTPRLAALETRVSAIETWGRSFPAK